MHRVRVALVVVVGFWVAAACARKPDAPAARGDVCATQDDCNRDADGGVRRCGALRLCVAGHCEAARDAGPSGSRVVACAADAGSDAGSER
jgi:hypothetical protein